MKLNDKQKHQLETLLQNLKHKKLRKLLKRAIPIWEKEGYSTGTWGTKLKEGFLVRLKPRERWPDKEGCCLIGASTLGLESKITNYSAQFNAAESISEIIVFEYRLIQDVFDDGLNSSLYDLHKPSLTESNRLLVEEICKIREILGL